MNKQQMQNRGIPASVPQTHPRLVNCKTPVVLFPGAGIAGEIDFNSQESTAVVDELSARRNVNEFTSFINNARKERQRTWGQYWERVRDLNAKILRLEHEAYAEGAQLYAEEDFNDEEQARRSRVQPIPVIVPNVGAFDLPKPPPYTIPDPPSSFR